MLASVLPTFGLIYYFAPNPDVQKFRWVLPGMIAAFGKRTRCL